MRNSLRLELQKKKAVIIDTKYGVEFLGGIYQAF